MTPKIQASQKNPKLRQLRLALGSFIGFQLKWYNLEKFPLIDYKDLNWELTQKKQVILSDRNLNRKN